MRHLKCICKELLITDGGLKTDTNIGSNGDGSSLEVPRTSDLLGEQTSALFIGQWSHYFAYLIEHKTFDTFIEWKLDWKVAETWLKQLDGKLK